MMKRIFAVAAAVVVVIAVLCALFIFRDKPEAVPQPDNSVEQQPAPEPDNRFQEESDDMSDTPGDEERAAESSTQTQDSINYSTFFSSDNTDNNTSDSDQTDSESGSLKDVPILEDDDGNWGPIQW